jgi:hypothetical protein
MIVLCKFLDLASADRRLLLQVAFLLEAIRFGLWLFPFGTFLRLLPKIVRLAGKIRQADQTAIDAVPWAVRVVARYVPVACLVQAMVTHVLLKRVGCSARLRIGIARPKGGRFEAHAWVESQGRVIIGGPELSSHYIPLPPFEERTV